MYFKLLQKERFKKRQKQLVIWLESFKFSKTLPKNDPETKKEEMITETFIALELRHEITDELRLKQGNYWWSK